MRPYTIQRLPDSTVPHFLSTRLNECTPPRLHIPSINDSPLHRFHFFLSTSYYLSLTIHLFSPHYSLLTTHYLHFLSIRLNEFTPSRLPISPHHLPLSTHNSPFSEMFVEKKSPVHRFEGKAVVWFGMFLSIKKVVIYLECMG